MGRNAEDQLRDSVRHRRQQREARQLVGIILALEPGLVAGLLFQARDDDRAAVDQRIREHQPARRIPVARVPEERIASQQDEEDPERGLAQEFRTRQALASWARTRSRRDEAIPQAAETHGGQQGVAALNRKLIAVPGHRQVERHDHPGADGPDDERQRGRRLAVAKLCQAQPDRLEQPEAARAAARGARPNPGGSHIEFVESAAARPERPEPAEALHENDLGLLGEAHAGRRSGNSSSGRFEISSRSST